MIRGERLSILYGNGMDEFQVSLDDPVVFRFLLCTYTVSSPEA